MVASMVVTWWIAAFLPGVYFPTFIAETRHTILFSLQNKIGYITL